MIAALLISAAVVSPDIDHPVWKHLPATTVLAKAWPLGEDDSLPQRFDIDLRCRILNATGHVRCIVVGESPAGYGVGAKVAAAFSRFALYDMRAAVPGQVVIQHYVVAQG